MNEPEYILNNDVVGNSPTEQEKEIMRDMQLLSNKCMEQNIPCFLSVKFSSNEDPTAAWHFGKTEQEGLYNFSKDIAPLFLYVTSQITGTKIVVTNPETGNKVYEINPSEPNNNG
jgi:hypothetical protein